MIAQGIVQSRFRRNLLMRNTPKGGVSTKRPGSCAVYLEMHHGDIEDFVDLRKNYGNMERRCHDLFTAVWVSDYFMECLNEDKPWYLMCEYTCPGLSDAYGEDYKNLYQKYVSEGKYTKEIKARDLWDSVLKSQIETGAPYVSYKDAVNMKTNQKNLGTIKSSNLCVHPETMILTEQGYFPIGQLENQIVKVWNGEQFSETTVMKTGEDQKLLTVKLDNNVEIKCTPYHKFYIERGSNPSQYSIVKQIEAKDLSEGDRIIRYEIPLMENFTDTIDNPYTQGLLQENKTFVPINYSIKTKLDWLAGLVDKNGCVIIDNECKYIQFTSVDKQFILNVMYMLNTLGIQINICDEVNEEEFKSYRATIDSQSLIKLQRMGFETNRLDTSDLIEPHHKTNKYIRVKEVVDENIVSDTYCFNEPLKHAGVFNGILTSQCNEINIYSDANEYACCVLSSIPLGKFVEYSADGTPIYNYEEMGNVARFVVRMLNKIVDINDYPVEETRRSNLKHRPLGIGVQGLADTYFKFKIPYDSPEAYELNEKIFEALYYNVVSESMLIAKEREELIKQGKELPDMNEYDPIDKSKYSGAYSTFEGSPASQGILQFDLWGQSPPADSPYNWNQLKEDIKRYGMRNSLLLAVAPTATTSQICGQVEACEPLNNNLYKRSVKAGEFSIVNKYMIQHLRSLGLWNKDMHDKIIMENGSIQNIQEIPLDVRQIYKTCWDISQKVIIEQNAARGKYICQTQSMNLFMRQPTLKRLFNMHNYAWKAGLKTGMYYLRTRPAVSQTKFTIDFNTSNADFFSGGNKKATASTQQNVVETSEPTEEELAIMACSRANPEACEMCSA